MNDYGTWLRQELGVKVQKLSVDAGFTCPNRDGTKGLGGCTFCNNRAFVPSYAHGLTTVTEQLEAGKRFFSRKYPEMRYLAYFQAYTGTYAHLSRLRQLYDEALSVPDVVGLVVGTRPDCLTPQLLDLLEEYHRRTFLLVEYGVESANDKTLRRVRRGHTFADSERAIRLTAERGIRVGAHVILGLPGEDHDELMRQARLIARLPLNTLKLHQLQIIRDTPMEKEWQAAPWPLPSVDEYIDLVLDYIALLPPGLVLDRFVSSAPKHLLVAPQWGLKNHEFTDRLNVRLSRRGGW
ncbi:MAG: TIGR01212 family radical SAM protein [Bacteroidaceae bacterium]|nr:TIGR01212 family radical SAM protein [Bacteroidaceae bacterium]